jgi:hypothetical protein
MSVQDEYRRHAEHALARADEADDEDDRATWMWVAKGWLGLLPAWEASAEALFDEEFERRWTGQELSEAFH